MKIAILVSNYTPERINRNRFSKISSREIPHNKCVSKIFIFLYKKWYFLKKNKDKIRSKYTLKCTKLHRFKKFSRGSMPPNPSNNAHGFAMRSMSLRDMQIPNSQKKNSWPPPSQILGTPLNNKVRRLTFIKKNVRNGSNLAL